MIRTKGTLCRPNGWSPSEAADRSIADNSVERRAMDVSAFGSPNRRDVGRSLRAAASARSVRAVVLAGLIVTSCSTSSTPGNGVDNNGTSYTDTEDPGDRDAVVPPVDQGVGGGAATDNLNDYESNDDVDGDGSPD